LLNLPYPTYGDVLKAKGILSEGEGLLEVFDTPGLAILAAGWSSDDTSSY
jgi:hypothetical protein